MYTSTSTAGDIGVWLVILIPRFFGSGLQSIISNDIAAVEMDMALIPHFGGLQSAIR
jgi:hypothetical protein